MKRLIYIAAVAGLTLVGCTKNEVRVTEGTSDQLITFSSPVVGVATKANVGYQTTDPAFRVYGKMHTGDYNGWSDSGTYVISEYMNTRVEYNDSESPATWYPTPKSYTWPNNSLGTTYKLSFLAYSPDDLVPNTNTGAFGVTGVKFEDYVVNEDANIDLLYSKMTYNQETPGDGTTTSTVPEYEGVNIQFQHALSSINFKVKTDVAYAGTTIKIKEIRLQAVNSKGSFDQGLVTATLVTGSSVGGNDSAKAWTEASPAVPQEYVPFNGGQTVNNSPTAVGTEKILLPQNLSGGSQKVYIKYTTQTGLEAEVTTEKTLALKDYTPGEKWEIGKKYTYTIVIGLKKIFFAPEVIDWVGATTTDIAI